MVSLNTLRAIGKQVKVWPQVGVATALALSYAFLIWGAFGQFAAMVIFSSDKPTFFC